MKKSRRYCLTCREITTFKKKQKDKHSYCCQCKGWRAGKRRDKKVKINKVRRKIEK